MSRLEAFFCQARREGRKALVTFMTAGAPNREVSMAALKALPEAGADIIELGMPFSDPMADGPAIQASSLAALENGMTLDGVLEMVRTFRAGNTTTPLVLMGYFNPIFSYGAETFACAAADAGVDGLIIVDLPPEEEGELLPYAQAAGLDLIHLVTPTTDAARLAVVLKNAGGFLYYVSITGITGTASADPAKVGAHLEMVRKHTDLPLAVGFGIKTPDDVRRLAPVADGLVVGSAIVNALKSCASPDEADAAVRAFVGSLSSALQE